MSCATCCTRLRVRRSHPARVCDRRFFSKGPDLLGYVVIHHKTARGDANKQIGPFTVDADWNQLALTHAEHGHRCLLRRARGACSPSLQTHPALPDIGPMFIDPSTGCGFTESGFRAWFSKLVLLRKGVALNPHAMRHHLVTELVCEPEGSANAVSAFNSTVAHLMGNSLQEWSRSYCLAEPQQLAQAAIDALQAWRLQVTAGVRGGVAAVPVVMADAGEIGAGPAGCRAVGAARPTAAPSVGKWWPWNWFR